MISKFWYVYCRIFAPLLQDIGKEQRERERRRKESNCIYLVGMKVT